MPHPFVQVLTQGPCWCDAGKLQVLAQKVLPRVAVVDAPGTTGRELVERAVLVRSAAQAKLCGLRRQGFQNKATEKLDA